MIRSDWSFLLLVPSLTYFSISATSPEIVFSILNKVFLSSSSRSKLFSFSWFSVLHSYLCDNCVIALSMLFEASAHLCPNVNLVPSSEQSALQLLIAYLNEVLVSSMRINKSFLHSFLQLPRCFRKQHHLGVSQRLLQKCWSREYLTRNACSRYLAYPWQSHESLKIAPIFFLVIILNCKIHLL